MEWKEFERINRMKQAKIPKGFLEWFKSHFTEKDLIDVEAYYDRSISIEENQNIFAEKFSRYYIENPKEYKEIMTAQKEQKKAEETKQLFKQRKTYLEQDMGVELNFVK